MFVCSWLLSMMSRFVFWFNTRELSWAIHCLSDVKEGYFLFFLEQEVPLSSDSFRFIGFLAKKEEKEKETRGMKGVIKSIDSEGKYFDSLPDPQLKWTLYFSMFCVLLCLCKFARSTTTCMKNIEKQHHIQKGCHNKSSQIILEVNFRVKIDSDVEDEWMKMKIIRMRDVVKIDISYLVLLFHQDWWDGLW